MRATCSTHLILDLIILIIYGKKVKSKAVPLHAMEAHWGGGRWYSSFSYLTSATRWRWVVSVTPRPRFTPGERTPGTHWIGGWVGFRAGLDAGARRKILCPCRGSNPDRPARRIIYGEYYKLWSSSSYNFWRLWLLPPSLIRIVPSAPCSQTPSMNSFLRFGDQVSHPSRTTDKITLS
jgi:hypothetical protein